MKKLHKKVTLAKMVRQKLAEMNVSQEDFSLENSIDPNAFRTQLARNSYSSWVLEAIAKLLSYGLRELSNLYSFNEIRRPMSGYISPIEALKRKIRKSIRIDPNIELKIPL